MCELGEQGVLILLTHGQAGAVQHLEAVTVQPEHLVHVPVSYTHLDVYKRQLLSMLPFVLVSFRHGVKWGLFTGLVNGCPVSYTHLDVYKRQAFAEGKLHILLSPITISK